MYQSRVTKTEKNGYTPSKRTSIEVNEDSYIYDVLYTTAQKIAYTQYKMYLQKSQSERMQTEFKNRWIDGKIDEINRCNYITNDFSDDDTLVALIDGYHVWVTDEVERLYPERDGRMLDYYGTIASSDITLDERKKMFRSCLCKVENKHGYNSNDKEYVSFEELPFAIQSEVLDKYEEVFFVMFEKKCADADNDYNKTISEVSDYTNTAFVTLLEYYRSGKKIEDIVDVIERRYKIYDNMVLYKDNLGYIQKITRINKHGTQDVVFKVKDEKTKVRIVNGIIEYRRYLTVFDKAKNSVQKELNFCKNNLEKFVDVSTIKDTHITDAFGRFEKIIEEKTIYQKMMSELDEVTRSMVYLHYVEDRTFDEIGTIYGVKKSAVNMRIKRALKKFSIL